MKKIIYGLFILLHTSMNLEGMNYMQQLVSPSWSRIQTITAHIALSRQSALKQPQESISLQNTIPSFDEWKKRCDQIPHFRDSLKGTVLHDFSKTATSYTEFMHAVYAFENYGNKELGGANAWVGGRMILPAALKLGEFKPFVQAVRVEPGTELIFFGDRHGDVRSTLEMVNELKKKGYFHEGTWKLKANAMLIGLGDYVDRGNAGVETLLTMLWLKIQNPDQVILVRGNHEDSGYGINKSQFQEELKQKLGKVLSIEDLNRVNALYNYMPVAVFIGSGNTETTHFIVGCHGFLELGYHPRGLLEKVISEPIRQFSFESIGSLQRTKYIKELPFTAQRAIAGCLARRPHFKNELTYSNGVDLVSPTVPFRLGWMWSYAIVDDGASALDYDAQSRTWQWGKQLTHNVLDMWSKQNSYTVSWVIRGHQHSHNNEYALFPAIMQRLWKGNGLYKLWSNSERDHAMEAYSVFSVNVAPDNIYASVDQAKYPGFNYDTCVVVSTALQQREWKLRVINKTTFELPCCPVEVDGTIIVPQKPYPVMAKVGIKNSDNFYPVQHNAFYRSKLLSVEALEKYIKQNNIKGIVNLRDVAPEEVWYQQEVALCKRLGVSFYNISFHPSRLPTREQLAQLLELFDQSDTSPLLVHCLKGADRTGFISALFVLEKLHGTLDEAIAQQAKFFGHRSDLFPHMLKCISWWHAAQKRYPTREQLLNAYDPALFIDFAKNIHTKEIVERV